MVAIDDYGYYYADDGSDTGNLWIMFDSGLLSHNRYDLDTTVVASSPGDWEAD